MDWINRELQRAVANIQWTSIVVSRKEYIDALNALKAARDALDVSSTQLRECMQLVISSMEEIDALGK